LQGSISGSPVFEETFYPNPVTNANGLVTVEIGGGVALSGNFATIDWSAGPYFLKTETDPNGGTLYTITGTSQLLAVPYALHAKKADSISGGINETDPVFGISPANGITNTNIGNWNTAYGWGNHATAGYLTSFTETDPVFGASPANGITNTNIGNWNTAYGWGNHASAGYLTSYTETDPVFGASPANGISNTDIGNWNTAYGWGDHASAGYLTSYTETDPVFGVSPANGITNTNIGNWNTAYGWGNHATAGYLTSYTETDPVFGASPANGITNTNIGNWNTAFGWGNHATAGYLTSYTETDPLWTAVSGNYYTKLNLQTSGEAQVHFDNITNKPTTLSGYGITDAVASNAPITAGTGTKITYDEKGLVTSGENLTASDIPDLSGTYLPIDGGTMTGNLNADGTANLAGFNAAFTVNTTTTYTLAASDNGKVVGLYNASAITLYVPDDLPVGFNCLIMQTGVGKITFTASGTTTIKNRYSFTRTSGRYAIATLIKIGGVSCVASGDME